MLLTLTICRLSDGFLSKLFKKKAFVALVGFCCFLTLAEKAMAQLTVTGGLTQAQIQSLLFGPDVTITNFVVKCPNGSFGSFNGINSNIGLNEGVILSTGNINEAPGPNNTCGAGGSACTGSDNPTNGGSDACLDAFKNGPATCVVGGSCAQAGCYYQSFVNGVCKCMGCSALNSSSDACGVEFDVTPTCDTIKINYVFASEEYPEFVNGQYSDAFAFFISGPGIAGTVCNNSKNIALVPGTTTPINIDNVNANKNSQYFIDNGTGTTPLVNKTVQYDGFTKILTAKTKVTPCATYHIKMVIADYGDWKYNSAVFLQKGGINCGTPSLAASKVDAIECCSNNGSFTLTLAQAPLTPLTVFYTLGGTATSGTDYTPLPGSIVVPAGQTTVTIPVNVLCDNIAEGAETIILNVGQAVCAGSLSASATLSISDGPIANAGADVNICSTGTTLNATGGGTYSWSPATGLSCTTCASPVATPLVTTKYVVAVTNNGCVARDTVVVTVSCGPTVTVTSASVCAGSCQTITATATGGTAPYTYSWSSSGATGVTLNACPSTTTTYTVKTTDNTGASSTTTATVSINPVTNLVTTKTDVSCAGGNNGTATGVPTGGSGPYVYVWSAPGGTSATISNLVPGTYTVTSTDSKGCTQTTTATIIEPTAISLSPATGSAGCGTSNGTIAVTGSGGTGAITYVWSNGSTGATINGVAAGSYTVTATDSKSCTKTLVIAVSNIPAPTIDNLTGNSLLCNGINNGSATITASGGTAPLTYTWSNGISGATITGLSANTYVVSVKDASGCLVVSTVSITEPPAIIANTNPVSSTCGDSNGQASVTASGGTGALTYNWSPPGGTAQTVTGLAAATYTVTVNDAGNCTQTTIAVVNNIAGGLVTTSVLSDVVCNGGSNGSATSNVTGGSPIYTYVWNNGSTSQTINNLVPGTYTVTATDAAGCTSISSVTITEPASINLPAPVTTNANCGVSNGSATAFASGGNGILTYSWSNGSSGATADNLLAGTYTVTVNDANGCTTTAVANVSNNGGPSVTSVTPTNLLCKGVNTGSATVSVTSGNTPYTYIWSNGTNSISTSTQSTITSLQAATYTVTIKDANSCQVISTVEITEPAAITITFVTSNAACGQSDGSATAAVSGGTGLVSFLWSNGTTGETANNLMAATYTVTATDANACTQTSVTNILNVGAPTATASVVSAIACNAGTGSVSVTVTGGTGPYTYSWSNGASSVTDILLSVINGVTASTYTVTVTDSKNCITLSTVTLAEPAALIATAASAPSECGKNNGLVVVSVQGGVPGYVFNWSNGAGGMAVVSLAPADYTVTVTDSKGCTATSSTTIADSTFTITSSVPLKQTISEGASIDVVISGAVTYTWSPATGLSCTTCPNPVATPTVSTIYTVAATDAGGCTVVLMVNIIVKKPCVDDDAGVFIANVFSPNNDGLNDVLYVQSPNLSNIYWSIYDRWGNLIFESFDQKSGWDGTKKGNAMDAGVYVYYLKATCTKTNSEVRLKGNVTIIR